MNLYHKRFLTSFSCENVIALFSRYRGSAKEITESWAMLEAAKRFEPNLDVCMVVVVGDGCSPRTGALLAYFTKAHVVSVDPNFNMEHWREHATKQTAMGFPPQRIRLIKDKIENVEIDCLGKPTLVLWPHSHADMNGARLVNFASRMDISMPCCVPPPRGWLERPHLTYQDFNVASPHRTMRIWTQQENAA